MLSWVTSFSALLALVVALPASRAATIERRLATMGTTLTVEVEAPTRAEALAASEVAVQSIGSAEARLSTWRSDSELATLNRTPVGQSVALSPELNQELAAALRCAEVSGGAFDPTVAPLISVWGLREGGHFPPSEQIARAQARVGWRGLSLESGRATRLREIAVEEGGFGKGAALHRAAAALSRVGIQRARLDLGGQIALLGSAWVPIAHPARRAEAAVMLRADGGSVATSGNSERGLHVGHRRIGHLLDPHTGKPAADFGSLTVWTNDALWADCLSTALFVGGPDAALAFTETHPDVHVLIMQPGAGGELIVRASPGLRGRLRSLEPNVRIAWGPGRAIP